MMKTGIVSNSTGKQLVFMTDSNFQTTGYAVLIEDDPKQKYT